jgi:IS30 family transposase
MKPYKHLSKKERDKLAVLYGQGKSLRQIGVVLGRPPSTILRELKRNGQYHRRVYLPHKAQGRAVRRRHSTHARPRLLSHALRIEVERLLLKGWSPELISGRLKRKGAFCVSHEAIYQWIYKEAPHLIGSLVRSRPTKVKRGFSKRRRRIRIPQRVSIQERPAAVNTRKEPGHWETDLVVGQGRQALQVAVERATRLTRLSKTPDKTAPASSRALEKILEPVPLVLRKSVTYDNGLENADHVRLQERLGIKSYFCEPYHSWEKGTVENTNGLIRRFLPKRTDLSAVPDQKIQEIEEWLNERPRKCLGFKTPAEAVKELGVALASCS